MVPSVCRWFFWLPTRAFAEHDSIQWICLQENTVLTAFPKQYDGFSCPALKCCKINLPFQSIASSAHQGSYSSSVYTPPLWTPVALE